MRRELRLPKTARMVLLGAGVLGFAIGSFMTNASGGIISLVSALLIVFLFLFTTSGGAADAGEGVGQQDPSENPSGPITNTPIQAQFTKISPK